MVWTRSDIEDIQQELFADVCVTLGAAQVSLARSGAAWLVLACLGLTEVVADNDEQKEASS